MRQNTIIFSVMIIAMLVTAACDSTSGDLNAKANDQTTNNSATLDADGDATDQNSPASETNSDESTTENTSESLDNTTQTGQDDSTTTSNGEESHSAGNYNGNNLTETNKEAYLQKLNEMEEADRHADAGTTMPELEEQEAERYEKWDTELNEIYAILQEQLPTEQMDELREEQRDWIEYRDDAAKEASLQYEGGTTETLEYIATQATLTRDRCYELVAQYMN